MPRHGLAARVAAFQHPCQTLASAPQRRPQRDKFARLPGLASDVIAAA